MVQIKQLIALGLTGILITGCGAKMTASSPVVEYRLSAGTTTLDDFLHLTPRILNDYRYFEDRREDRGISMIIETQWVYRKPSDEELAQGILDGRYRLIVECRRKSGGGGLYNVKVIAWNYIRHANNDDWVDAPLPEKEKLAVKRFTYALKNEYENKIRVF